MLGELGGLKIHKEHQYFFGNRGRDRMFPSIESGDSRRAQANCETHSKGTAVPNNKYCGMLLENLKKKTKKKEKLVFSACDVMKYHIRHLELSCWVL